MNEKNSKEDENKINHETVSDEDDEDEDKNPQVNNYLDYEHEAKTFTVPAETKIVQNNDDKDMKVDSLKKKTEEALKVTVRNRSRSSILRTLVSQNKNRFRFDGFDLDLTYITTRIIAMGLPSTSLEGIYRNNMKDVVNFFNTRHHQHYKVYNLCEEKQYPENMFYKQGYFPFKDHEAPPLNLIKPFCEDCKNFLDNNENNVIAVHCLAGKGRTGTFISCLLLYLKLFDTAAECLKYYGKMRVNNGKGVTVPSQIRYVFYFEKILQYNLEHPIKFKSLIIKKIRMITIPKISKFGSSCSPSFSVENKNGEENNIFKYWHFDKKRKSYDSNVGFVDFELGENGFQVNGDVRVCFYQMHFIGKKTKIFKFWFNTNFVPEDGVLEIKKDLIDKACKDKNCKQYKANFKIEVHTIDV